MEVDFDQLTVGGRGLLTFDVTDVDSVAQTVTMRLLSAGAELGTVVASLATDTAAVTFKLPLLKARVDLLSQVFVPGDVVIDSSASVSIVFSQVGDQVFFDPGATGPHPSSQYWKIGSVDLSTLALP